MHRPSQTTDTNQERFLDQAGFDNGMIVFGRWLLVLLPISWLIVVGYLKSKPNYTADGLLGMLTVSTILFVVGLTLLWWLVTKPENPQGRIKTSSMLAPALSRLLLAMVMLPFFGFFIARFGWIPMLIGLVAESIILWLVWRYISFYRSEGKLTFYFDKPTYRAGETMFLTIDYPLKFKDGKRRVFLNYVDKDFPAEQPVRFDKHGRKKQGLVFSPRPTPYVAYLDVTTADLRAGIAFDLPEAGTPNLGNTNLRALYWEIIVEEPGTMNWLRVIVDVDGF